MTNWYYWWLLWFYNTRILFFFMIWFLLLATIFRLGIWRELTEQFGLIISWELWISLARLKRSEYLCREGLTYLVRVSWSKLQLWKGLLDIQVCFLGIPELNSLIFRNDSFWEPTKLMLLSNLCMFLAVFFIRSDDFLLDIVSLCSYIVNILRSGIW